MSEPAHSHTRRLTALRRGDAGAFTLLVREMATPLHRHACLVTGDPAAADDVVQQTFVSIWRNRRRLAGSAGELRSLCYRTAFRLALNQRRSERSRGRRQARVLEARVTVAAMSPVDQAMAAEVWEDAMALPPALRDVVLLRFADGRTLAETADALGLPEGTVTTRQRLALARLRERHTRAGAAALAVALLERWQVRAQDQPAVSGSSLTRLEHLIMAHTVSRPLSSPLVAIILLLVTGTAILGLADTFGVVRSGSPPVPHADADPVPVRNVAPAAPDGTVEPAARPETVSADVTPDEGPADPEPEPADGEPRVIVIGTVTDDTGAAISGASVRPGLMAVERDRSHQHLATVSANDGTYRLEIDPREPALVSGMFSIRVSADGHSPCELGLAGVPAFGDALARADQAPTVRIDFSLPRLAHVRLTVVDGTGEPVARADVRWLVRRLRGASWQKPSDTTWDDIEWMGAEALLSNLVGETRSAITGVDGTLTLPITPWELPIIVVGTDDLATQLAKLPALRPGEFMDVTVRLANPLRQISLLLREHDQPVPNHPCTVYVYSTDPDVEAQDLELETATDGAGRVQLVAPPGTLNIVVATNRSMIPGGMSTGVLATTRLAAGADTCIVDLPGVATLTVRLLDATSGRQIPFKLVAGNDYHNHSSFFHAGLGRPVEVATLLVPADALTCSLRPAGRLMVGQPAVELMVHPEPGELMDLVHRVHLVPAGTVELTSAHDSPRIRKATLTRLHSIHDDRFDADADGRWTVDAVPGRYWIDAEGLNGERWASVVEVSERTTTRLVATLRPSARVTAGVIEGEARHPGLYLRNDSGHKVARLTSQMIEVPAGDWWLCPVCVTSRTMPGDPGTRRVRLEPGTEVRLDCVLVTVPVEITAEGLPWDGYAGVRVLHPDTFERMGELIVNERGIHHVVPGDWVLEVADADAEDGPATWRASLHVPTTAPSAPISVTFKRVD